MVCELLTLLSTFTDSMWVFKFGLSSLHCDPSAKMACGTQKGLGNHFLSEWVRSFSKSPSSAAISLGPDPSPDRADIYASVVECFTIWIGSACHHMVPCPYVMWLSLYVEALLTVFLLVYRIDLAVLPSDRLIKGDLKAPALPEVKCPPLLSTWWKQRAIVDFHFGRETAAVCHLC